MWLKRIIKGALILVLGAAAGFVALALVGQWYFDSLDQEQALMVVELSDHDENCTEASNRIPVVVQNDTGRKIRSLDFDIRYEVVNKDHPRPFDANGDDVGWSPFSVDGLAPGEGRVLCIAFQDVLGHDELGREDLMLHIAHKLFTYADD